jgi:hypothetical protein
MAWAPIVGEEVSRGLDWLERAAGAAAVWKFLGGKIRGTSFSGQYLLGIADFSAGRQIIHQLLELLREGQVITLCDVDSYYRAGKHWPLGMCLIDGQLLDVWEEVPKPSPVKPGLPRSAH